MNRIKTISARNLKGLTFSHNLAPVNLIVGENASGKTAVLAAVRLALLGHDPKLGKTPGAIFASCGCKGGGATSLTVSAIMDSGPDIARAWVMKKGKISYEGVDTEFIPTLLLDPTTYFSLTGPARLNYVLGQCDLAVLGIGCKPLIDQLLSNIPASTDPAAGKALTELCNTVLELDNARMAEDSTVYDWLIAVVEKIKDIRDKAAAIAATHEQTIKGLTDGKAADGDMSVMQSVQPDIDEARARHTAAVQAEANALNAWKVAERKLQEVRALALKRVDVAYFEQKIQLGELAIVGLQKTPPAGPQPTPEIMPTRRPSDAVERTALNSSLDRAAKTKRIHEACQAECSRIIRAIELAGAQTTCPTCGHDIADKQKAVLAQLKKDLAKADQALEDAAENHNENLGMVKNAEEALSLAESAITTWGLDSVQVEARNTAAMLAWMDVSKNYNLAQENINKITNEIARLRASIDGNAAAHEAWVNLPGLEAEAQKLHDAALVTMDALTPIAEQIKQLEAKQRQFIARTQDARRVDQSRALYQEAQAKVDVYKAALKVVAAEKDRVSEDAFKLLLGHARKFTDGILKAPLQYRDGELGYTHDGNWVSYKAFSGLEELLCFCALSVALTQKSECLTRVVLLDEMTRAIGKNKGLIAQRMLKLTKAGVVDQVFMVDGSIEGYPTSDDLKVIQHV